MNERVPDSSGLPLRAMVMVLLFLGVIFLLVGFQAMGSGNDSSDDSSAPTVTTTTSKTTPAPAPKADVRVFNVSSDEGVAARTGDRLREAGWNVTETGNLTASEVTATAGPGGGGSTSGGQGGTTTGMTTTTACRRSIVSSGTKNTFPATPSSRA